VADLSNSLTALATKTPEEPKFTPVYESIDAKLTSTLADSDLALQTRFDYLDALLAQSFERQLLSSNSIKAGISEVRDEFIESVNRP
jgi:hypothetical protein